MRTDQNRDRDAIQRDCITSHIDALKVQASVYSCADGFPGNVRLSLYEPTESKNVGSAKLSFDFDSIDSLDIFIERIGKVAKAFRHHGSVTTEDVEVDSR